MKSANGYRVYARRSPRRVRQRFYVTISSSNGQVIFTSEQYRDHDYALELGKAFADKLEGSFVDLT